MSNDQSNYIKILELSYEHLPDHLKPCFLYMGRFREDQEVPTRKVMKLWAGEGFVLETEEKSLENVAEEYLFELVNRSLLMIVKRRSDGGIKACGIHDLLRDMCLRKAEEEKFLKHIKQFSIYEQHSHLVSYSTPEAAFAALHCRSLTGLPPSLVYHVTQMPLLRVIDKIQVKKSPSPPYGIERLCTLVHLKYLCFLFSTSEFPVELCKLINLEYLQFNAYKVIYVPLTILVKMVKLRHACIETLVSDKSCEDSRTTDNLKSLSHVLIRSEEEGEILRCSPHLQELKCISDGSLFPDLNSLKLESLSMKFTRPPIGVELTGGYFPLTLKKLSLYRTSLPWKKMTIVGTLSNLCVLKLFCCAFVGEDWIAGDGEFEDLRFLKLSDVSLNQWAASSEHFPKLECLVLEFIRGLVEIPCDLGCIPTLERIEVRHCRYEIEKSAVEIEKKQREYGNDDLKVVITSDKRSKLELEQEKFDNEELTIEDEDNMSETGVLQEDIELVMNEAWVSRGRAVKALKNKEGDIVAAIMELT